MARFKDYRNIHEMLLETVERRGDHPAYRWFAAAGEMEAVSWNAFYDECRQAARSLVALGIGRDDKVTIVSYSCYRWVLIDLAAAMIGAVTVGIYHSLTAKDVAYIADHSDSVLAFVQDAVQLEKLTEQRQSLPAIRNVVLFSGDPAPGDDWAMGFDTFLSLGDTVTDAQWTERIDAVTPEDVAAIVYTSGTTGIPKGAMLTHDNMTFTAQSVEQSVVWFPDDQVFLFLPLAHVFARTCVYTALLAGTALTFCRGIDTIAEDIKVARPNWFPSVPRIYEKVRAKIIGTVEAKGGVPLKLFKWAMFRGECMSYLRRKKLPEPLLLKIEYAIADRLVFRKIRDALGGRVRWCISGAAPLNPDVGKFFHAAGILIVEGIGMTENTSFSNLNRYDNYRFGWVGPTGPGIEQKIADDGEILFRGRNVMKGYYKMPDDTAAVIGEDGWLRTGDLGEIDEEGFLRVTGRKKELIVTSGGKNISPARIEGIMADSPYIQQICIIGDQRNFLTALVTLEPDAAAEYALKHNIPFSTVDDLIQHPEIVRLVESHVKRQNKQLGSFETIKKVALVPEFTIENGLLTPTLKVRKSRVLDQYKETIEALYDQAG